MNLYSNDATYNISLMNLLKVFYPLEDINITDYEQSTFRVTVGDHEAKVAYFSEGREDHRAFDPSIHGDLKGLDEEAYNKALKTHLRGMLFDLCTELTGVKAHWGILTGIRPTKLALKLYRAKGNYSEAKEELMSLYRVSEDKADLLIDVIKTEEPYLRVDPARHSVYIGIPFCPSKCSYCTFTSFQADCWPEAFKQYVDVLIRELEAGKHWLENCYSIYLGGGTPTSLTEGDFAKLLKTIRALIGHRQIEFTVEAGRPDSITREKLLTMKKYGVNRISINPQTMQNGTLERIGRKHDAKAIVDCYNEAREVGFGHINMDLILGLPGEDEKDVGATLAQVIDLHPQSITVHTLAFKRGSKLSESRVEYAQGAAIDRALRLVQETMTREGYHPYYLYRQKNMVGNYENVGYCQPGYESVYNIIIMEECTSIIAFGAGAISKRVDDNGIKRLDQPKDVQTYINNLIKIIEKKEKFFNFPTQKAPKLDLKKR